MNATTAYRFGRHKNVPSIKYFWDKILDCARVSSASASKPNSNRLLMISYILPVDCIRDVHVKFDNILDVMTNDFEMRSDSKPKQSKSKPKPESIGMVDALGMHTMAPREGV